MLTLAVIGAAGVAIVDPGIVKAFYQDIYPSDPAKRQALELCFMQDHKFNRLEASERERCYHRMLQPLGEISSSDPAVANLVDLQRAAGQGSVPRNDIRRLEQNENPPHAPH
ncbi:MAG TPA: hypothetical protein VG651_06455 [Stellaceae bacterium]|nr:hypothetical protein [Stellaceae bacterium]